MSEVDEDLPAWSAPAADAAGARVRSGWPAGVTRDWAFGGSTGAGIRVAVVDSGVDGNHPLVGPVERSVVVTVDEHERPVASNDAEGDLCGHGTACAGVIRSFAPGCELHSVRVLGEGFSGTGAVLIAGLRWAVAEGYDVINLSLSTTRAQFQAVLHELTDVAWFKRTVIVASAHNMPVDSYPWRFAAVVSVGSHDLVDPWTWYVNPEPPVDLYARGYDVEVAWLDGATIRSTGNSFATPHVTGLVALLRAKHPDLDPAGVKTILRLTANNVGDER